MPVPSPQTHIFEVAQTLGIRSEDLIPFGRYKAKVTHHAEERLNTRPLGRYILVTAIPPTPLGEGKTTTSIGLSMGLCRVGYRSVVSTETAVPWDLSLG
ncbi:MAG: formate--tetrahydrofolate ligase [Nitrospira sp.]|nr:formate--tetrahydrofolate ligase [Nitrospira sp.]